jgi:hypothetical protein
VTARWLSGSHEAKGDDSRETWAEFAIDDLGDVDRAEVLVEFTQKPFITTQYLSYAELNVLKRGGRHVEFGYAYAKDKLLILVGPRENVFHNLFSVHQYDNWAEARAFLAGMQEVLDAA